MIYFQWTKTMIVRIRKICSIKIADTLCTVIFFGEIYNRVIGVQRIQGCLHEEA